MVWENYRIKMKRIKEIIRILKYHHNKNNKFVKWNKKQDRN